MSTTRIPWGYAEELLELDEAERRLLEHHHPEFVRRLVAWLEHKAGRVGIGGGWRAVQPDADGFAPPGKSFHQDQAFADGFVGAVAVDLVLVDGPDAGRAHDGIPWAEVPQQGSTEAARWGVHCNIGNPSLTWPAAEPWHMQPVEIDGYDRWLADGRPAPVANYPIPTRPEELTPMPAPVYFTIGKPPGAGVPVWYSTDGLTAYRLTPTQARARGNPIATAITPAEAARYAYVNTLEFVPAV